MRSWTHLKKSKEVEKIFNLEDSSSEEVMIN